MVNRTVRQTVERDETQKNASSRLSVSLKLLFLSLIGLFFMSGCGKRMETLEGLSETVIVKVNGESLTIEDVNKRIPVGLLPEDSAALFNKIIETWVRTHLLADFAEERLSDFEEIDRKVNEYRSRLIIAEYIKKMRDSHQQKVPASKINEYYEAHKDEMITEVPLVKGIFIKIPEDSKDIPVIKGYLKEKSSDAIDKLEDEALNDVIQYDNFRDSWIDWQLIQDLIPERINNPDAFLSKNKELTATHKGVTYILSISSYLPSKTIMPKEFAESQIVDILDRKTMDQYETDLINSLIRKAQQEKKLVYYTPEGVAKP